MSYENTCDVICVHEDKVNNALSFLEDDKSKKLLNILEKICDEKKLKIILSLIKEDELCVCDISLILKMSVASTSHHLRLLYKNEVLDFWGTVRKMRIYNAKPIFKTITPVLTTLRKF